MCLAIPGKVISIDGQYGVADFTGVKKRIVTALLPKLQVGQWVIVHAGYAIEIVDEEAAKETLAIWQTMLDEKMVDKADYI